MLKSLIPARPLGRLLLAAAIATGMSTAAQAGTGFFGNIYIVAGDGVNTFYQASGPDDDFNPQLSAGWGTLNQGDNFQIKGFEINTFEFDGSEVQFMNMFWSIDSFVTSNQIQIPIENIPPKDGNNRTWQITSSTQNLLTNGGQGALSNGSYTFQAFFEGYTNAVNTDGNIFENNGTNNYTATFEVVPEPSTYALLGLGVAFGLWQLRRRRKLA
jgi:flagellar hook-associated protein FlgK